MHGPLLSVALALPGSEVGSAKDGVSPHAFLFTRIFLMNDCSEPDTVLHTLSQCDLEQDF